MTSTPSDSEKADHAYPLGYSPMFDAFVPGDEDDQDYLSGLVAYALYKSKKQEWAKSMQAAHRRAPTPEENRAYTATWTPRQIESTRKEANEALVAYGSGVVQAERPIILREALKGNFERDVGTSIVGALIYTVLLIAIAFSLRIAGIDFFGIYDSLAKK